MTMNIADNAAILSPEDLATLFVQPVSDMSTAAAVSTIINTSTTTMRVPKITVDPTAAWTAEGEEIAPSDATTAELTITPKKLAGLSIITAELADDSSPEAVEVVGHGLARDIARQVDAAYFGTNVVSITPSVVKNPNKPAGLEDLAGFTPVNPGASWTSIDPFIEAIFEAEKVGASLGAFVANPADALILANLKEATSSKRPLLQPDPTKPTVRLIGGVPLLVSPHVSTGTIWGLDPSRSYLVIRDDAEVVADRSAFFTSHRVALRATMRIGFGWAHPASVVKLKLS